MQESAKKDIQESAEKDTWESADSAEEDIHEFWQPHLAEPHGGSRSSGGSNDGGADTAGGHDGGADPEPQSQDPKPPWPGLETMLPRPPPPRLPPPRLPELSYSYFCIQCHTKPSWNGEANEHCSTQCRDRAVQGV